MLPTAPALSPSASKPANLKASGAPRNLTKRLLGVCKAGAIATLPMEKRKRKTNLLALFCTATH